MKFSDFVLVVMVLSFLPLHEGIIAKSPRWKGLADAIELGARKVFGWRANAGVTRDLVVLERHFLQAALVSGLLLAVVLLSVQSRFLFLWASCVFFFCFLAWISFRWSFKHREAVRHLAPIVGYSLIVPWVFLLLARSHPETGVMGNALWLMEFLSYTPLEVAAALFLLFVAVLVVYRLFLWLVSVPFAYAVLVGLKASRALSAILVRRFKRNLLTEISVFIQVFGLVYFYWLGK